jgi:hypothetical protein
MFRKCSLLLFDAVESDLSLLCWVHLLEVLLQLSRFQLEHVYRNLFRTMKVLSVLSQTSDLPLSCIRNSNRPRTQFVITSCGHNISSARGVAGLQ